MNYDKVYRQAVCKLLYSENNIIGWCIHLPFDSITTMHVCVCMYVYILVDSWVLSLNDSQFSLTLNPNPLLPFLNICRQG